MSELHWSIYVLKDPRTMEVRYVGWTKKTVDDRLQKHISRSRDISAKKNYVNRWILALGAIGLSPIVECIENGVGTDWKPAERKWIAHFRSVGVKLTNLTDGGEGTPGRVVDPTECIAISERAKRRWSGYSPERKSEIAVNRIDGIKTFWKKMSKEERTAHMRKRWAGMSTEERSEFAKKRWANIAPDRQKEIIHQRLERTTLQQRSERGRNAIKAFWAGMTPEEKSEFIKRRAEKQFGKIRSAA